MFFFQEAKLKKHFEDTVPRAFKLVESFLKANGEKPYLLGDEVCKYILALSEYELDLFR